MSNTSTITLQELITIQRAQTGGGPVIHRAAALACHTGLADGALENEDIAECLLVAVCRADDPQARGSQLWRYTRNGCRQAIRGCRICGARTSWCNSWPRTTRSLRTEAEDIAEHIAELRDEIRSQI